MESTTVITRADRVRGVEAWLLLAAPDEGKARAEWEKKGAAILTCGTLFTAVRIPGSIVRAAAGTVDPETVDRFLREAVDGGAVFAVEGLHVYYALVPGGTAYDWFVPGADCLFRGVRIGVPAVRLTEYAPGVQYWASPMDNPGDLCTVDKVEALVLTGWRQLKHEARGWSGES
ncbi:hypothetical protein ACIQAC_36155 [Streptomyces sp. NPDC088387]|uniref:hypothetical protein n=1 Tax=Streptomyces sp. NPDC088387 TaxID=3365859 RepID=UPI00380AFF5B